MSKGDKKMTKTEWKCDWETRDECPFTIALRKEVAEHIDANKKMYQAGFEQEAEILAQEEVIKCAEFLMLCDLSETEQPALDLQESINNYRQKFPK